MKDKVKSLATAQKELLSSIFVWHKKWLAASIIAALFSIKIFLMFPHYILRYEFLTSCIYCISWFMATVGPVVCLFWGLWLVRHEVWNLGAAYIAKKGIYIDHLKGMSAKSIPRGIEINVEGIHIQDEEEVILEADSVDVKVGYTKDKKITLDIVLTGLDVHFITYDPRFHDTNLSRILKRLSTSDKKTKTEDGEAVMDQVDEAPDPRTETEEDKKKKKEQLIQVTVLLVNCQINILAGGPLGVQGLVPPIKFQKETIDPKLLTSKVYLFAWIQGLALRAIAASSLDAVVSAFGAAGHDVEGAADLVLGTLDSFVGKLPGGSVLTGVSGGAREILGGTFDASTSLLTGTADAGKAIISGITSGTASGVANGFQEGGIALGNGVKGAGVAIGTSVKDATYDIGNGFYQVFAPIIPCSSNDENAREKDSPEDDEGQTDSNTSRHDDSPPRRSSFLQKLFCAGTESDEEDSDGDQEKPKKVLTSERKI